MIYDNVTFMMCLPRSRSAWLAEFLAYAAYTLHDPLAECESIEDLGRKIDHAMTISPDLPVFVADTSAVYFAREIHERFPNARYLFVYREYEAVYRSLQKAGLTGLTKRRLAEMLERWSFAFRALDSEDEFCYKTSFVNLNNELRNIWRFVGLRPSFNETYASGMAQRNITVPTIAQMQRARPDKMAKLFQSIGLDYVG